MSLSEFQFAIIILAFLFSIVGCSIGDKETKFLSAIGIILIVSFAIPTFKAYNDPIFVELLNEAKESAKAKDITFFNHIPTDEKVKLDAYAKQQGLSCYAQQTTDALYICFKKIF